MVRKAACVLYSGEPMRSQLIAKLSPDTAGSFRISEENRAERHGSRARGEELERVAARS